jgi:outer membrane receptor protein involved in Fe transport
MELRSGNTELLISLARAAVSAAARRTFKHCHSKVIPMKSSPPFNKVVLLVSTMLLAPSLAWAQTEQPTPDAPLEDGFEEEEEIVVIGRNIPEPMRETSEVVSILSAEDLARTGDDNAALALTRLSGLSVVSGRFVYVRGLGDRYSSALLNGSPLPSPEPLRRQVPLDLFPSNILDGANVQKTFSPNYPGEFGGGVIDLRTTRLPLEPFLTISLGTGFDTESNDLDTLTYFGERSDWTGWSDGRRDVPALLQDALGTGQLINNLNFTDAELEAIGESLVNSPLTVIQSEDFVPDFNVELTSGTSFDLGRFNVGLVGVAGYDSSIRSRNATRDSTTVNSTSRSSSWDVVINALGSVSVGWDENEISLTGLLVRSTSKDAQIDSVTADANAPDIEQRTESTAWYERQLYTLQLAGEHRFGDLEIDWRSAIAESSRDAPYERFVTYDITPLFPTGFYSGRTLGNGTRFSDLSDETVSAGLDLAYTISISPQRDLVLLGGLAYSDTDREYIQRNFAFLEDQPSVLTPEVRTNRVDYLFAPDNIGVGGFVFSERTGANDSYLGSLEINAAYAGVDAEIIPLVRTAVGFRYEDATQTVTTFNTYGAATIAPSTIDNEYLLPAATVTWNFAEDLQLRLGYSQTIARPQFRELAFSPFIDPDTDRVYEGNPFLVDSEFVNYDARLEYYFGSNQFVTFGGFYKTIDNPIEEVVVPVSGSVRTRFANAPEATLYGAEVEYRTRFEMPFELSFLPGAEWLFSINYTYTFSEVTGGDTLVVDPGLFDPAANQTREDLLVPAETVGFDGSQLQGTPENIVNLQFGVETDATQLTLLVGWVDERIARRGLGALPSVIEDPGVNVDLVFRHNFVVADTDLTLGISGRNLLAEPHVEYQQSGDTRLDVNTYDRGQSFSISLTARY